MKREKEGREVTFQDWASSHIQTNMRSSVSSSAQLASYLRRSNLDAFLVGMVREGERGKDKGRERREGYTFSSMPWGQSRT